MATRSQNGAGVHAHFHFGFLCFAIALHLNIERSVDLVQAINRGRFSSTSVGVPLRHTFDKNSIRIVYASLATRSVFITRSADELLITRFRIDRRR